MSFTDMHFIVRFLTVFLIIYYLVPVRWKNPVLLIGSIYFLGAGDFRRIGLLAAVTIVNYAIICGIRKNEARAAKALMIIGIILDAGVLTGYKYFSDTLPLGISFYTFMAIASLVDVYRHMADECNLLQYATYMFMFPKLIQGPIVPLGKVSQSLAQRKVTLQDFENGLETFVLGMALKVIVADQIGKLWGSVQMVGYEAISTPLAWLGMVAFSMQLYFDFWGYSMMAMGLGQMLGFDLGINFDHPYRSLTVSEFYRRWHVSLGRWFREYVYIPMGGNRKGTGRLILNLLVVWAMTGIWHGSSLNFLLWAAVLVGFILLEKLCLGKILQKLKWLGHIYIWLIIPVTWVIFAITDFPSLASYLSRLFPVGISGNFQMADALHYGKSYWWVMILAICLSTPLFDRIWEKFRHTVWMKIALAIVFWICLYYVANGVNNPFMYAAF